MLENIQDFFLDRWDDFLDFKDSCSVTQLVCMAGWVVCLIIVIISFSARGSSAKEFDEKFEENQLRIMELQQRKDALTSETDKAADAAEVEVLLKSAVSAGSAVAGLQSAYQDCVVYQEGQTETVKEKMERNAKSLSVYFDEDSENAQTPWFTVTSATPSRLTWKFMTNYSFTADTVEVLWTCVDSSKHLCAFATGTYTVATNLFSDVKVFATAFGNSTYRQPDDPVATYDMDPETGEGIELEPSAVGLPEGYHFNEFGDLVNADGEVYMGDENWAAEFEDQFKAAKDYREQVQAAKAAQAGNAA